MVPVIAMVVLTVIVWLRMYQLRIGAILRQKIKPASLRTRAGSERFSESVNLPAENFQNLLEVPVLFYVVATFLFITHSVDAFYLLLAWIFVGLRYVHTFIHITYNNVLHRFSVYTVSFVVLMVIWARLAIQLLSRI